MKNYYSLYIVAAILFFSLGLINTLKAEPVNNNIAVVANINSLTKRELFAVLCADVAYKNSTGMIGNQNDRNKYIAHIAVEFADALIEELDNKEKNNK